MPHFPPPPPMPAQVGRFHRVPPAIFPPTLGLMGLVIAWGYAARVFGLPLAPVEVGAGMVTLLFLFCTMAYVTKVILRPGVIVEELHILPGRTGLAAWCLCAFSQATILVVLNPRLAMVLLAIGAAALFAIAMYVLVHRLRGTDPTGPATPTMHLVFVGFVLVPGVAIPLQIGLGAMPWLLLYCLAAGLLSAALTIRPLILASGAPPLRPLQAIQLAPASFVAIGAIQMDMPTLAVFALIWAGLVLALLIWRVRWLTEGQFSGFWSAFTFPVTALSSACLLGFEFFDVGMLKVSGGVILVVATLYIPMIAYKTMKLWADGTLAAKTNAAIV